MLLFSDLKGLLRKRDASFSGGVSMLTRAEYGFHVIWLLIQNNLTAGLQDIHSMYITQENPLRLHFICLLLKNDAASILLASALEIVPNVSR